jgi:hypothetical protein
MEVKRRVDQARRFEISKKLPGGRFRARVLDFAGFNDDDISPKNLSQNLQILKLVVLF